MKEKGKERSQFYYTSPAANFASEGLDASQSIPIKPSIYHCFIWGDTAVSKQAGIIAKPAGTLDRFRPIPSACILRHSTSITYLKYYSINALKPDSFDSFDSFDILDKFNKLN
jgi:hypothetical protein